MTFKRLILLIILLIILSLCFSCSRGKIIGHPLTFFSGIVTDSISGTPIDSAMLILDDTTGLGPTNFTDSLGHYEFDEYGFRTFTVFCLKDGYYSKLIEVTSSEGNFIFDSLNFDLVRK